MMGHAAEKDWIDLRVPCRSRSRAMLGIAWQRGLAYKSPKHEWYPVGTPETEACNDDELFYNFRTPPEVIDRSPTNEYGRRMIDDAFARFLPYRAIHVNQLLQGHLWVDRHMFGTIRGFSGDEPPVGAFERRFLDSMFKEKFSKLVPLGDPDRGVFVNRSDGKVKCVLGVFDNKKAGGSANLMDVCGCPWDSTSIEMTVREYSISKRHTIPACIENYHDLKDLTMVDHVIADVTGLERAPSIEHLDLGKNVMSAFPGFVMSSLHRLKKLDINDQVNPKNDKSKARIDVSNLRLAPSIESLDVSGNAIATPDAWMNDLPRLRRLDASNSNLCVVPAASKKPALKELVLNNAGCSTDGKDIATWKNLERLEIENTSLKNPAELGSPNLDPHVPANLEKLKVLDLSRNEEIKEHHAFIGTLPNLKKLRLYGVDLPGIEFVKNLLDLEVLDVSDSYVSDFTPLAGLTKLSRLNACSSKIADDDDGSFKAMSNVPDVVLRMNNLDLSTVGKLPNAVKLDLSDSYYRVPLDLREGKLATGSKLKSIDLRLEDYETNYKEEQKATLRVLKKKLADRGISARVGEMPQEWHVKCPAW